MRNDLKSRRICGKGLRGGGKIRTIYKVIFAVNVIVGFLIIISMFLPTVKISPAGVREWETFNPIPELWISETSGLLFISILGGVMIPVGGILGLKKSTKKYFIPVFIGHLVYAFGFAYSIAKIGIISGGPGLFMMPEIEATDMMRGLSTFGFVTAFFGPILAGIVAIIDRYRTEEPETRTAVNYCPNCASEIDSGVKFCPKCGNEISSKENRPDHSQGEDKLGEKKAKAKEKIENLLQEVESLKKSGRLSSNEERELRDSLDKAIKAYETGDYEKSLKHGRKTEFYIYSKI